MDLAGLVNNSSMSLASGSGTMFVGSGISAASGLPTWAELLRPFARGVGLELTPEDNLPQIAQFIVNQSGGNRGPLVQAIKDRLLGGIGINSYHESLQRTNLRTIWTTNYDTLLEDAFRGSLQDVKAHDDAISRSSSSHQIEIIKMHGCIATSQAKDLVLTLEDYEDFFRQRPATAERLKMDLLNNSLLFVGYGYGDPDISNILVEARRLANQATRQHYMIQLAKTDPAAAVRQRLWVRDLLRVGIACVLVEDYEVIGSALQSIALKSRGPTVFVTGGHQYQLTSASDYGRALADIQNLVLLDGQSEGISRAFISAYTEVCLQTRQDIRKRIHLFPNPYAANAEFDNDPDLLPELKKWRSPLLRGAQVVVVFHGSMGTQAELDVAKELGCVIVPVPVNPSDLPSRLILQAEIRERLAEKVPTYLERADARAVTPGVLKECVQTLLST